MVSGVVGAGFGHGRDVWGRWFSCGVAQCAKALISIFQQFSASIYGVLGLDGDWALGFDSMEV